MKGSHFYSHWTQIQVVLLETIDNFNDEELSLRLGYPGREGLDI